MITPLTITSLSQGKDLARRQVEKLNAEPAEPAEPAPQLVVEDVAVVDPAASAAHAPRRSLQSLAERLLSLWDAALPIGAWRI